VEWALVALVVFARHVTVYGAPTLAQKAFVHTQHDKNVHEGESERLLCSA